MTTETAPNRRLIQWFIGTAIFTFTVLLHVTFPNMGGSGLRLPFNAAVWMGFGLMMALSMWPATRGVIRYSAFHKGLGLLLLALWLPFLWTWNEASLIALPRMLTVTAGAILLLGLAQLQLTRRDWWWLGMAILLGALMETALGYVQHFVLEPGNFLGYDPDHGRPWGIFQKENVLATFLVTGLAISAWLLSEARGRLERSITLLAPLFMPGIILLLMSRSGWIGFIVAAPLVIYFLWSASRRNCLIWFLALLAGSLFAWVVWSVSEPGRSSDIIHSAGQRPYLYAHVFRMILEKPWTGWGYGRFQHDFLHSYADWRALNPDEAKLHEYNFHHPHNELLLWGMEGGVLPVIAIVAFSTWLLFRIVKFAIPSERPLLMALPMPVLVHTMLEYPFYHSSAIWLVFLIIVGLIEARCWRKSASDYRFTFSVKAGALLGTPLLIIFMTTHVHTLWLATKFAESGGKDNDVLSDVVNPFGMGDQLNLFLMEQRLYSGIRLGMKEPIKEYIEWAKNQNETLPLNHHYINIYKAQHAIGHEESENKTREKIEHLYNIEIHKIVSRNEQQ